QRAPRLRAVLRVACAPYNAAAKFYRAHADDAAGCIGEVAPRFFGLPTPEEIVGRRPEFDRQKGIARQPPREHVAASAWRRSPSA
ncbi:MAG TPA: hypothetical protein VMN56_13920, partial [Casimicrobiaceae bacterium]|nr:hypothetical protein [Casimicrobiaceae bacterium]